MPLAKADLDKYVGRPIRDICSNGFYAPSENHCAHFVSHALGISLATRCGDMQWKTRRTGATIRCNELYNLFQHTGPWDKKPQQSDGLLIFVISARNIRNGMMSPVPEKHVGLHWAGGVYNYSNSKHKVVLDPSVEVFHNKFKAYYAGGDISLYYGVAP